ncbi:MAG TPA: response regulator, partial [Candidatus Dormibacteraeota bacterium]
MDHETLFRFGLAHLLGGASGIEVVALAADHRESLELVRTSTPDVVIMDVIDQHGVDAVRQITGLQPTVRVLV